MRKKIMVFLLCLFCSGPLSILAADDLILGGDSIGIEVTYDGVMVSGTYRFEVDGKSYDPSTQLKPHDIIVSINGTRIHSMDDLYAQLNKYQDGVNDIPIRIKRNQEEMDSVLISVFDKASSSYKSGLYIKDKIAGVGTMTYYDPLSHTFGFLGHEIYDSDLKQIADVHSGTIYPAQVKSIQKAQDNVPGEKHAQIDYTHALGDVLLNSEIGIYGTYDSLPTNAVALPWAKQDEIQVGPAKLYTVLDGERIDSYDINITKLNKQSQSSIKGIEFEVSDQRLLEATNGIIQGMSGSPIVQNGKIIGAVTHVVTSHPINGYGVYIEWMLDTSRSLK